MKHFRHAIDLIYLFSIIWFFFSPVDNYHLVVCGVLLTSWLGTRLTIYHWVKSEQMSVLVIFMLGAVSLGFALKLPYLINHPELSWVAQSLLNVTDVQSLAVPMYALFSVGYASFLFGFWLHPASIYNSGNGFTPASLIKIKGMFAVMMALFGLKVFAQSFFNIGLAGVRQMDLGIPYLTGIISLLTGPCIFMLVNITLFCALTLRKRSNIIIALLFVFMEVSLSLVAGYKHQLVFELAILLIYILIFKELIPVRVRQKLIIIFTLFGMILVVIYPYVNYYRYALLQNHGLYESVQIALINGNASEKTFILEFLNRINGLENFLVALFYLEGKVNGISFLFSTEISSAFKVFIYGDRAPDALTAFGLTQFSALYLSMGIGGLIIGPFLFSFISVRLYNAVLTSKYLSPVIIKAFTPILAIFFVKVMLSGGGLLLFMKEFLVIVSGAFAMSYLFVKKSSKVSDIGPIVWTGKQGS